MNECPNPDAHDGSCCDGYEGQIAVLQQAVKDHADRIAALEAALLRIAEHPDARDSVASIAYGEIAGGEAGGEAKSTEENTSFREWINGW